MGFEELTAREREVADVAATGASTKSIAEQLYVSRRTVESHLGSMYRKLGVSSRPALVAVLLRAGGSTEVASEPGPAAPVISEGDVLPIPKAFVGREGELATIRGTRHAACESDRRAVVLVGGEAGVGKSTLIAAAAREARADGATVLVGHCDEAFASAFGPVAEALAPFLRAHPDPLDSLTGPLGGSMAAVIPDLESRLPPMSDAVDAAARPRMLADAVVHVLATAAHDRPVVLVLEDLQWADRATVALIRRIISAREPRRLLVVASFRDTDLTRAHPLPGLLADLWRVDDVVRIHLQGLEVDDALALARQLAPDTDEAVVRLLHAECAGNAFFLTQLLRHGADANAAARSLPDALRDVVLDGLRRVDETLIEPLQLAAVVGLEVDLAVMEAAAREAGLPRPDDMLDQLERAVGTGLLTESAATPGRFAFTHDLARQALLGTAGPARAARLHRSVGLALLATAGDDTTQLSTIAAHLGRSLDPEDRVRAGRLVVRAVHDERSRLSPDDAVETASGALAALPDGLDADGVRIELLVALADIHGLRLDAGAHRQAVLDAVAVADRLESPVDRARALTSFRLLPRMGTLDTTMLELTDSAIAALGPGPSALRARLAGYAAYQRALGGDGFASAAAAEAAVKEARATGDLPTLATTLFDLAGCLLGSPEVDRQLAVGTELLAAGLERPGALGPPEGRRYLGVAHLCVGDRAGFDADVAALNADAERTRKRVMLAMAASWRVLVALGNGQLDEAERHASQTLAEAGDDPNFQLGWFAQMCAIRAEQGRASEMIPLATQIVGEHADLGAVRALYAWLLFSDGKIDGARDALAPLTSCDGFAALPADWLRPGTLGLLAPVVAAIGPHEHRAQLLALLSPYRAHMLVLGVGSQVVGAADRFAALLEARLGDREGAARSLDAADELEHRLDVPLLAAHTAVERALLLAGGDRAQRAHATRLLREVAEEATGRGWAWVARRVERATAIDDE